MNSRKTFLILATHYMQLQNLILKLNHIQVQESLHFTTLQWEKTSYNEAKQEHTEHVWNDGEVQKEATCTEEGSKLYTCIVCGDTKTEVIPAAGHNYSTEWTIDKEATTTEEGSKSHHCTVCGDKADITVIPKLENTQPGDNDNKSQVITTSRVQITLMLRQILKFQYW